MAFGVPSFIGLHYKVFDLCQPFLALLAPVFLSWRSLTGIEMRGETLRDFSISSERKLERRGEKDSRIGQNLIYFRSFLTFFFVHNRAVVLIFQLPVCGVMVLDCISDST